MLEWKENKLWKFEFQLTILEFIYNYVNLQIPTDFIWFEYFWLKTNRFRSDTMIVSSDTIGFKYNLHLIQVFCSDTNRFRSNTNWFESDTNQLRSETSRFKSDTNNQSITRSQIFWAPLALALIVEKVSAARARAH